MEARVGFEPTDGGFADLSLRPLGYRAGCKEYNETAIELSVVRVTHKIAYLQYYKISAADNCGSKFLQLIVSVLESPGLHG